MATYKSFEDLPVWQNARGLAVLVYGTTSKGKLKDDGFLVGIETTPGEPIFIPPVAQDLWEGKYYAVVLYASESETRRSLNTGSKRP